MKFEPSYLVEIVRYFFAYFYAVVVTLQTPNKT